MQDKVVLITGGARRVGAVVAKHVHALGMRVLIHCNKAVAEAERLCQTLNAGRENSAAVLQADLTRLDAKALIGAAVAVFGRLDVLLNNASLFYPTPFGEISDAAWREMFAVNASAPLFLAQAAAPHLHDYGGNIINIVDIHAERPIKNMAVYCMSKSALAAMTKALARELAPEIRVNGIAPGMILWPDEGMGDKTRRGILQRVALQRGGEPEQIAETVEFLLRNEYITGQIIAVDGGRSLNV